MKSGFAVFQGYWICRRSTDHTKWLSIGWPL